MALVRVKGQGQIYSKSVIQLFLVKFVFKMSSMLRKKQVLATVENLFFVVAFVIQLLTEHYAATNAEPDELPHSEASALVIHCLATSH